MSIRLAMIPPRGLEHQVIRSDKIQLMLALPELLVNPSYIEAYRFASRFNDYIIMDNGAAEGTMQRPEDVVAVAKQYKCNEIVAPDYFRDATATYIAATKFAAEFKGMLNGTRIMAVPQGQNEYEVERCLRELCNDPLIDTIGIPRNLVSGVGDDIRIRLADIAAHLGKIVHLLGTSPLWIEEVRVAASALEGMIRSCDTSAAFNYTIAGQRLCDGETISRPKDYFKTNYRQIDPFLLRQNVLTLRTWARGDKWKA